MCSFGGKSGWREIGKWCTLMIDSNLTLGKYSEYRPLLNYICYIEHQHTPKIFRIKIPNPNKNIRSVKFFPQCSKFVQFSHENLIQGQELYLDTVLQGSSWTPAVDNWRCVAFCLFNKAYAMRIFSSKQGLTMKI